MSLTKKIAMGAGAMTIGLGLLAVLGVGSAVAKSTPTGSVTCTGDTGSIKFSPGMTLTGTSPETATVSITITNCTGGSSTPTKGTIKGSFKAAANNCTQLESPPKTMSETLSVSWSPSSDGKTTAVYGPVASATNSSGDVGFSLTGTASGSYAGSASFKSYSSDTATELGAACGSKAGLTSMSFTSGTVVM